MQDTESVHQPGGANPYRILSIDGGGVRGVYAATLLDQLAKDVPNFLSNVDLFAGTSTGGIIALGLASGKTPADLVALYKEDAEKIFPSGRRQLGWIFRWFWAEYSNKELERVLVHKFPGDPQLKDLEKKVLVPSFDLDGNKKKNNLHTWKPKFFNNYGASTSDDNQLVVNVALRTSAAPTYFPVYERYIDGGMVANNPSMAALAQSLDPKTGKQKLGDIRLFSVGTGESLRYISSESMRWGILQWACHKIFPDLVIDGMMDVADYECRRIINGREDDVLCNHYFRLAPPLPQTIDLDDAGKIKELIKFAGNVPTQRPAEWNFAVQWLQEYF